MPRAATAAAPLAALSATPAVQVTATPGTGTADAASRVAALARLADTEQRYRDTMVYPLWSRPADASNAQITRWNHPISVGQTFAVDARKREIAATARLDRVFVDADGALTVQLTASHVADGSPAPLDEAGAQLQWRDHDSSAWQTAQAIPLHRGDGGWAGTVVPSRVPVLRAAPHEARVVAYARAGEFAREFALDFTYAAEPPVTVHGIASDRVVDGQLEIGLDVELATAAPIHLMATLFAADGTTAIAVLDDRIVPQAAGRRIVALRFFGKILHDRQIAGPYRLGAVHGYVYRQGAVPDQLWFARGDAPEMRTAAYAAAAFSPDAYRSPDVAAQLARYAALRSSLTDGHGP